MFILLTSKQRIKTIISLSFLHIFIITSSNYLIQLPITIFSFHLTYGTLTFPFLFLITDIIVRIYGISLSKKIIAVVMLPSLFISYIFSVIFYQGKWNGFAILSEFNLFVIRVVIASFMAYILGQIMNIFIFNKLRNYCYWWIAPTIAMIFGNLLDTITFFFIAFYHSNNFFMAENWIEIALVDYNFKLFIFLIFLLPSYKRISDFILSHFSLYS
ncbi:MAG: 7-cyano-7-deazaguanine/7-aminomethyl-7-deazaguanine transporter [Arsenophonus sp.]